MSAVFFGEEWRNSIVSEVRNQCFTCFVSSAIGPMRMVVAEQVSCPVHLASKNEANEKTKSCVLLRCFVSGSLAACAACQERCKRHQHRCSRFVA